MPLDPTDPRFFGRIWSFDCECPSCGSVLQGRTLHTDLSDEWRKTAHRRDLPWNPITGRLRCPTCRHCFATGILIYELVSGSRGTAGPVPIDHLPNLRQRIALQAPRQARLRARKIRGQDPTNWKADRPCSCPEGGWDAACPIHAELIATIAQLRAEDPSE